MAPPTTAGRPGRTLAAFLAAILLLAGLMFVIVHPAKPRLGLDLQGGTSITLTARATPGSQITPDAMNTAVSIIRQRVNSTGVSEADVTTQGSNTIVVSLPGAEEDELIRLVGTTAELRFRQVIQIAGGIPLPTQTPTPTTTPTGTETPTGTGTPTTTPTTSETPTGSTTPAAMGPVGTSTSSGSARGASVQNGLRDLAQTTTTSATTTTTTTPTTSPSTTPGTSPTTPAEVLTGIAPTPDPEVLKQFQALDCSKEENTQGGVIDDPAVQVALCGEGGTEKYLLAPAAIVGTDIASAQAVLQTTGVGGWEVRLKFHSDGARKFALLSQGMYTQPPPTNQFAIVLDGIVQSAPSINGPIPTGEASITGSFTQAEAQQLANVLKYGALPLSFTTSEVTSVTPTLGSDYLRAGMIAGAIGLILVLVYCVFYYKRLGIVVIASLAVAAALTYVLVVLLGKWIGFTLTLAGVAGLIVAIGITADSFIVFFERIRDEVRDGKTSRAAVEHGWLRARRTIISADFVSFLAAVVLYVVSIGNVRGFAFALGLTTVVDVIVVFLFTKPMVSLFASGKLFGHGSTNTLDAEHMGVTVHAQPGSSTRTRRTRPTRTTGEA